MQDKIEFLGLQFDNMTLNGAIEKLKQFIKEKTPHMVFTPNAALLVWAQSDGKLKKIYNESHLVTVDSWGIFYAARLLGKPICEAVSAARLMFKFIKCAADEGYRLYFLGAKKQVVEKAVENLYQKYPTLRIVGWHDGYFNLNQDTDIVNTIRDARPDVLFVAMSTPSKERFISKNLKRLNVPVCMGVGGSFDIAAGTCKLAPEWVSKMGLEWFYRLIQEPKRLWKRYLVTNSVFIWLILREIFKKYFKILNIYCSFPRRKS